MLATTCTKGNIRRDACEIHPLYFLSDSTAFSFPNLFTPNGDGINDEFHGYFGGAYSEFHLRVYTSSKTLFETNNPDEVWDGKYMGSDVREGVYEYSLEGNFAGIMVSEIRSITLIRNMDVRRIKNCFTCHTITPETTYHCN